MSDSFVYRGLSAAITTNVLQARVGGLTKHQLTLPTKGYLKILTLLVSRKLFSRSGRCLARERWPIPPNGTRRLVI